MTLHDALADLERFLIEEALAEAGGNKTKAAEALGVSRRHIIRKSQQYARAQKAQEEPGA